VLAGPTRPASFWFKKNSDIFRYGRQHDYGLRRPNRNDKNPAAFVIGPVLQHYRLKHAAYTERRAVAGTNDGFFLNSVAGGMAGLIDSISGLALGVLMLLPMHIFGRMGAGDVKLLGVVGSILGGWGAIVAGLATMIAGGLLALIYVVWIFLKPGLIGGGKRIAWWISGKLSPAERMRHFNWSVRQRFHMPLPLRSAASQRCTTWTC
jgi:hypothetical protein